MARVLLVDDDALVRSHIALQLEVMGHQVLEEENADRGLVRFHSDLSIEIVVTDVRMPGSLDGLDLAEELKRRRPGLPVLVISGNVEMTDAQRPPRPRPAHFLSRPFGLKKLAEKLRLCMAVPDGSAAG